MTFPRNFLIDPTTVSFLILLFSTSNRVMFKVQLNFVSLMDINIFKLKSRSRRSENYLALRKTKSLLLALLKLKKRCSSIILI